MRKALFLFVSFLLMFGGFVVDSHVSNMCLNDGNPDGAFFALIMGVLHAAFACYFFMQSVYAYGDYRRALEQEALEQMRAARLEEDDQDWRQSPIRDENGNNTGLYWSAWDGPDPSPNHDDE
jgi:hypothetical protein